jgi:hypothetical protein
MKKATMFTSKVVEKYLQENYEFREAYAVALEFFTKLIVAGSDMLGEKHYRHRVPHGGDGAGHFKFICGCHAESDEVRFAFKEAHRVEGHILLGPLSLILRVMVYRSGKKEPVWKHDFYFNKIDPHLNVLNPHRLDGSLRV